MPAESWKEARKQKQGSFLLLLLWPALWPRCFKRNLPDFPGTSIAFENHLNYFHCNGKGLEPALARGLAAYLNSTLVDAFFRLFNGHTQVNATDLRNIKYPTLSQLRSLGERIGAQFPGQSELDEFVREELLSMEGRESEDLEGQDPVQLKQKIDEDRSSYTPF